MVQADFVWLKKQAKDKRTKLLLEKFEQDLNLIKEGKSVKDRKILKLNLGNYKIFVRRCSALSSMAIYTEIFKEKGHMNLPQFNGKKDKVIFDVGANEGFYTLKLKENNPNLKIIAIEANHLIFQNLKRNIKENQLKDVILINKALSSKVGKVTFDIVPEVSPIGSLKIDTKARPWLKKEKIKKIIVESTTLEKVCESLDVQTIDLLKLDVEGAELDILKSSKNMLPNIKKIVVEYHSPNLRKEVQAFLKNEGFKLLKEEKEGIYGNFYFIRK